MLQASSFHIPEHQKILLSNKHLQFSKIKQKQAVPVKALFVQNAKTKHKLQVVIMNKKPVLNTGFFVQFSHGLNDMQEL